MLLLSGCQTPTPDFLERSQEDCAQGDDAACRMLSALQPRASEKAVPTQTERDVAAILQGMAQARLSHTAGIREQTPTAPPETSTPP